ncbi:MAG: hypothetical protein GMKNLPBB_00565 [Myxococcota bacterium]|nr:hypothetical protein [Myxococcota bacterium]
MKVAVFFRTLAVLLALAPGAVLAQNASSKEIEDLFKESEDRMLAGDLDGSNKILEKVYALNKQEPGFYWRMARNYWLKGESSPFDKKDFRLEQFDKAQILTRKALKFAPHVAELHFWYAASTGRKATTMGVAKAFVQGVFKPREILAHLEKVHELKPTYRLPTGQSNTLGDSYLILATMYRQAPRGVLAKMVTGMSGDPEKSLEFMRKAVQLEPNSINYNKELGVAALCVSNENNDQKIREEGLEALKKIPKLKIRTKLDEVDVQHSKWLVREPQIACKYNRDGLQEINSEFEKKYGKAEK